MIIDNLHESYLKPLLNVSFDTSPPHPALYIFDTCYEKMKMLNRVVSLLEKDKNLGQGNTIFHYYTLKNYPPEFDQYTFIHDNVIKTLLKADFSPMLANDAGEKAQDKIYEIKSYKEYQAKYLTNTLPEKSQSVKKLKL